MSSRLDGFFIILSTPKFNLPKPLRTSRQDVAVIVIHFINATERPVLHFLSGQWALDSNESMVMVANVMHLALSVEWIVLVVLHLFLCRLKAIQLLLMDLLVHLFCWGRRALSRGGLTNKPGHTPCLSHCT